jgi:PIN domain nuclease of toxin-antitoxin system
LIGRSSLRSSHSVPRILPVSGIHAEHAGALPRHHNDPFDRLIIAQAYLEAMVLGTQDRLMQPYAVVTLGLD